jgi:hypothetical protein
VFEVEPRESRAAALARRGQFEMRGNGHEQCDATIAL